MPLTSRDMERIQNQPFKEPWYLKILSFFFKVIYFIPWVKKKSRCSMGGLSGRIFRSQDAGDYKQATQIALFAMERFRNHKDKWVPGMEHHNWWHFVRHACDSVTNVDDQDLKEKIINEALNGIEPFKGYDVSFSFLQMAKWRYSEGEYDEAIKHAKTAAEADDTWAEPEFILGWFGLATGKVDPMPHLSTAICKDRRILFRIANDKLCKDHPQIIVKLKKQYAEIEQKQ